MKSQNYLGIRPYSEDPTYRPPTGSSRPFERLISATLPIVQQDAENFTNLLGELQGNILRHHHRNFACYYFLHFKDVKRALSWIQKISGKITSANQQFDEKGNLESPVCGIYLTGEGYFKLGLGHLAPSLDANGAFLKGMRERVPFSFEEADDSPLKEPKKVHAMLMLASNDPNLKNIPDEFGIKEWDTPKLRKSTKWNDLGWVDVSLQTSFLKKKALKKELTLNEEGKPVNEGGEPVEGEKTAAIEWFGYRDGISQPVFFPEKQGIDNFSKNDLSPLQVVLIKDKGGQWYSAGSFLAFLKLEQDVTAFNKMVEDVKRSVNPTRGASKTEMAEAYLVGRFKDGTPVTLHSEEKERTQGSPDNDFNYSDDFITNENLAFNDENGTRCPFHAHIRKANPRDSREIRLIARRGMLYDERAGSLLLKTKALDADDMKAVINWKDWDINNNPAPPSKEPLGTIFMSFQSSLEEQFEYILKNWLQNVNTLGNHTGVDVLAGTAEKRKNQNWFFPNSWNTKDPNDKTRIPLEGLGPCVRFKGGEYFYAPSITFLKNVEKNTTFGLPL